MSLFEDLIEELKEENLIEETVIETSKTEQKKSEDNKSVESYISIDDEIEPEIVVPADSILKVEETLPEQSAVDTQFESTSAESFDQASEHQETLSVNNSVEKNAPIELAVSSVVDLPSDDKDFYRRRATEEVSSLQFVEHIFTTVEREQMKILPKSYDAMAASIALHDFLKITSDVNSAEHSLAEFKLMGETEKWHSALLQRDKFISASNLRRYCESTRPALSSQALAALARFYRNSPFSEAVRNKFDLIITRLVTKDLKGHKREILFERKELVNHLSDLYADWSSIPVYGSDEDSTVLIASLRLEEFITEAESAKSFEELIKNDFFNRLRVFKDSTGENFFSPMITSTAIECNVITGNRYVELIAAERDKNNSEMLEEKYNFLLDQPISDATSKTFQLVELLNTKREEVEEKAPQRFETKEKTVTRESKISREAKIDKTSAEVEKEDEINPPNGRKNILLIALLAVVLIGGLYLIVSYFSSSSPPPSVTEKVDLDESTYREYFKAARINDDTYYGVVLPAWSELANISKEGILKKMLEDGAKKGYSKIHLMDNDGKTVGLASAEKGIALAESK